MDQSINAITIFHDAGFPVGRMIAGSKSLYRAAHPNNIVYFNANIFINGEKVWYGDLDLTLDTPRLKELASQLGDLFVLKELDGRFGAEDTVDVNKKAVAIISP